MPMKPFFNKTIISIICVVLLCFVVHVTTRNYYVAVHKEEMTSIKLEHQQSVSRAQTQPTDAEQTNIALKACIQQHKGQTK